MKTIQQILLLAVTMLSFNTAFAQYGYNGYGGGYNRNNLSQINQTPTKPREIPVEETVGKIMEQLKPELNLDPLQEIAIANIYTEMVKSQTAIIKNENINQEEKSNQIKALFEVNDRKINEYLNEEQKEKYKAFKENGGKKKKSKKKKR